MADYGVYMWMLIGGVIGVVLACLAVVAVFYLLNLFFDW